MLGMAPLWLGVFASGSRPDGPHRGANNLPGINSTKGGKQPSCSPALTPFLSPSLYLSLALRASGRQRPSYAAGTPWRADECMTSPTVAASQAPGQQLTSLSASPTWPGSACSTPPPGSCTGAAAFVAPPAPPAASGSVAGALPFCASESGS